MKKITGLLLVGLLVGLFAGTGQAIPWDKVKTDVWLQYRTMYNSSNIGSTDNYDFFRQRMRLQLDISPAEGVGGFAQIEYRSRWGEQAAASDVPFNRLSARGMRYGFGYADVLGGKLRAGILPVSDQLGDSLFSADWDFNVGGIDYSAKRGTLGYRVGYLRLSDTMAKVKDENTNFIILDVNTELGGGLKLGGHFYSLNSPVGGALGENSQSWIGVNAGTKLGPADVNGFVITNSGKIGTTDNSGTAFKVEAGLSLGGGSLGVQAVMSTGDTGGKGFKTPQGILNTGGYWGYTYIFSPHGPSDVNDFGAEIGAKGYGMTTIQAKFDYPISSGLGLQVVFGNYSAGKEVAAGKGTGLGTDMGVQLTVKVAEKLNLQTGYATASLGDAGKSLYGQTESSINEMFARFQLEF